MQLCLIGRARHDPVPASRQKQTYFRWREARTRNTSAFAGYLPPTMPLCHPTALWHHISHACSVYKISVMLKCFVFFFRERCWSYNPSVNDVLFCWFLTCNWGLCPQLEEHWPWYWSGRDWFSSFTSSHSSLCKNLCSMFRQRSREWTTTVNHYCHRSRYRKRVSSMCLWW